MITIGIDIGLTGALAAIDSRGSCSVVDLPTLPDGKGSGSRLDGRALLNLIRQFVPVAEAGLVLFEDVRPVPNIGKRERRTSIVTEGGLMRSRGIVEAVIDIARLERRIVQPQTWKRHYGLKREKDEKDAAYKGRSLDVARRLYPLADIPLAKHHNRAEALLIAHFGLDEPVVAPRAGTARRPQFELTA